MLWCCGECDYECGVFCLGVGDEGDYGVFGFGYDGGVFCYGVGFVVGELFGFSPELCY